MRAYELSIMLEQPAEAPGAFAVAISVMKEMNWSWADLQTAPAPLVDEVIWHIQARTRWQEEKDKRDRKASSGRAKHRNIR